jgi:hypothetical protein
MDQTRCDLRKDSPGPSGNPPGRTPYTGAADSATSGPDRELMLRRDPRQPSNDILVLELARQFLRFYLPTRPMLSLMRSVDGNQSARNVPLTSPAQSRPQARDPPQAISRLGQAGSIVKTRRWSENTRTRVRSRSLYTQADMDQLGADRGRKFKLRRAVVVGPPATVKSTIPQFNRVGI